MIPARGFAAALGFLVLVTVVAAVLPAGSAGAGAMTVSRVLAFAALAAAAFVYRGSAPLGRCAVAVLGLTALAAFAAAQSVVWPEGVVSLVSPRHGELAARAAELLGEPHPKQGAALSLAPGLSRSAALAILATTSLFLAAFVAGARRSVRRWLAPVLVGVGLFQIVLGLRSWLDGTASRLTGTFVNENHLAYLLQIGMAVAFAWLVWGLHARRRAGSLERGLLLVVPPTVLWLVLAGGLLATGSRGGLAAACVGLVLQCLLLPRAVSTLRGKLVPMGVALAAAACLIVLAVRSSDRMAETTIYELAWGERTIVWRQTLVLWRDFPLTGTGLGTFGEAFPLVQPEETTQLFWRRAHNNPLELLATGGLAGLLLGMVALGGIVGALVRGLWLGESTEDRVATLAALGAIASVGAHEVTDFGLTLPGVALPLAALVGSAAAVRIRRRSRRDGLDREVSERT